jgi:hypothetical protein
MKPIARRPLPIAPVLGVLAVAGGVALRVVGARKRNWAALRADHFGEERRPAASLFDASRMSVLIFASFFARLAPCRKRQRSQARFRDSDGAVNAGSVGARLEPDERGVDALHRLRPHLEQREIDVPLTVGVRAVDVVATLLRSVGAPVSNAVSYLALHFAPAIAQHPFQMSTSSCGVGHR